MQSFKQKVENVLKENILDFWLKYSIDNENGGFFDEISNELIVTKDAPKNSTICTRILWTYSAAFRKFQDEKYLVMANRAYDYFISYFWDNKNQGSYFIVDFKGNVIDDKKLVFAQAFSIYALTEFYLATGNTHSLNKAVDLFHKIEEKSYDPIRKGYFETYTKEWEDDNSSYSEYQKKSMNTTMHIVEAYTNLLSAWKNDVLSDKLKEILFIVKEKVVNKATNHLYLSFNNNWETNNEDFYFGLDIKASWLLSRAAEVLGDNAYIEEINELSIKIVEAVIRDGQDKDGGIFYKGNGSLILDSDKYWWPQAEALVGFINAYQLSGDNCFLTATLKMWDFLEKYIIDNNGGEWFYKVSNLGIVDKEAPKANSGKCPYHNGRACLELIDRI